MFHRISTFTPASLTAGAVALTLTLLTPTDGAAQQTRRVVITDLPIAEQMQIRTEAETSRKEADEILQQAITANDERKFRRAAELFERSGRLRTPGDRHGIEAFEQAGTAYFNAEKPMRASRAWEEAGNRALIFGNVFAGSQNYMRAAVAAQESGDRVRTSDLAWKAYHLTESPQLTGDQKRELRSFIRMVSE